jgi:hypothetical protein
MRRVTMQVRFGAVVPPALLLVLIRQYEAVLVGLAG